MSFEKERVFGDSCARCKTKLPEKSIGSFMTQYCIDTAKEKGHKAIRMDVIASNTPAMHLYKKFGFLKCGPEFILMENGTELRFVLFELNF